MNVNIWLLFLLTEFVIEVTPGPAVLLVSAQGFKYDAKCSSFGALGILTVSALYFILSSLGIITLILSINHVLNIVKYIGAIYLISTGAIMIYKSYSKSAVKPLNLKEVSYSKAFYQGLITEFSNPKAIIFFMAVLPQFITPDKNIPLQFAILGITSLTIECIVLVLYGIIANNSKKIIKENSKATKAKDRIAGAALIGIGAALWR
ncbi:MAG TPA: LysE family translocator [Candidatus Babeliaceae bacterium]|nr:LysE family translocator [Candidatus Babeliaceae bacterium]